MTYAEALSSYDNTIELVTSSNDFSRGFTTGSINTLKILYDLEELDAKAVKAILNTDFGFDDINLLRDAFLEIIKLDEELKNNPEPKSEENTDETNQE